MEQLLVIVAILIIYLVSKLLRTRHTPTADEPEASEPRWVEEDEDLGETWRRVNRERAQHEASETGLAPSPPPPPAPAAPRPVMVPPSPPTRPAPAAEHRVLPESPVIRHPEQRAPILSVSDWLNREGLRKAILAAEILGPCRARRPFRPGQR